MNRAALVSLLTFLNAAPILSDALKLHSENPRYFEFWGKPLVLITSGEHYGAVINLAFDYIAYLDELARHGLNHTRLFTGTYRETPGSFGIKGNTLAPDAEGISGLGFGVKHLGLPTAAANSI